MVIQTGLLLSFLSLSRAISISVPGPAPSNASKYVDPDFPGLAFEQASLVEYFQNRDGSFNNFSQNLIDAIFNRTGGTPLIRLGGTSADYGHYLPDQTTPALPRAEADNYQDIGNTTIGPAYWELTKSFPNAKFIIQLPMAISNVSEAVAWAKSAAEIIGMDRIQAFEPGNEVDMYPDPQLMPPIYQGRLNNETYVGNFTKYAAGVADAVQLPDGPFFQAFDTALHTLHVPTCFDLGINRNNIVKTVAQHYYQTNGGGASDLATGLMNHKAIAGQLDLFRPAIDYLAKEHPDIPYVMSEVGNSLNAKHDYDYQATLGSALWQVDFQLYGLTIGVAKFNFQQIMHSGFDLWLPVDSAGIPAQVFSNFYAQPFVADFVGSSGMTQVAQLTATGAGDNVVAYGAFVNGQAERVAVVNLNYWSSVFSDGPRSNVSISVNVPESVGSVVVGRLASPGGASAHADTMTYGGSQWTYDSLGQEVKNVVNDTQVLLVQDGAVVVEVLDSEAVILQLNGP
ncbi:glycoside hydrolase family 79 protein [Tolypocladium capitatum]|uniref:Glycoside hydrolase family 79 protein n=1 Tax=Tolypocladium capitatum TaxID=45235 RepID=A0A2K3QH65_9HYPO|nr:glycoside hydrolase family 79 protein [Tolypocladium capitatum]